MGHSVLDLNVEFKSVLPCNRMEGDRLPESGEASLKIFFDQGKRKAPGEPDLHNRGFPGKSPFLLRQGLLKEDIFSQNADFIELTSDDLIDKEGFLKKGLF